MAGEPSERARYDAWRASQTEAELTARSLEHTQLWHALTPDQQQAKADNLSDHRARWDLPRHQRCSPTHAVIGGDQLCLQLDLDLPELVSAQRHSSSTGLPDQESLALNSS